MKNVKIAALAIITLFSMTSAEARGPVQAINFFQDLPEVTFPIPSDNDVVTTFGLPTRFALPAHKMKFLVWNLHKGTEESFKYEYVALSFDRDIIMNQEVFLDTNMMDVFHYLPHFYFTAATSFFSGDEKIRTGVANISAVKPTFTKFIRTETLEPVTKSPKVALVTRYPIAFSMKKLTVVNLHGINFVSNKSFNRELERIYQVIKDLPSPLVFAGDFNTWNKDRLNTLQSYAEKLNLEEATFLPDNRITFNGNPLDHFFHTKDLKVTSARVDAIFKGSDHKPLLVEVEYTPVFSTPEIGEESE